MRLKRPNSDRDHNAPTPPDAASVSFFSLGDDDFVAISLGAAPATDLSPLSAAETGVLAELAAGRSNRAIAEARGTSLRTVTNQVSAIFRKLGVRSRAELALLLAGGVGARNDGERARNETVRTGVARRRDGAVRNDATQTAAERGDAAGRNRLRAEDVDARRDPQGRRSTGASIRSTGSYGRQVTRAPKNSQ